MKRYSGYLILLVLTAAIFAPFDVPFTLESVAKAMPVRQWVLLKNTDGSLTSALLDHRNGAMSRSDSYQFDRGDVVNMDFKNGSVQAGEAIVTIISNRLGEQLVQLKNQLAIEKATLGVVATGEKQELVKQLREQINVAQADLKLRKKALDRARQLYADGLIALQELELAENAHDESVAQLRVTEEMVQVGATGQKQESRQLVSSRIASLEREIGFLEKKAQQYTVPAPFQGWVRFEQDSTGERLLLEDTSEMVLFIPIRLRDSRFVQPGQDIQLLLSDRVTSIRTTVLEIGRQVEVLNREPVVTIKALTREKNLPSGTPIQCRLHCGEVRVAEFLKRSVQWK